MKNSWLLFKVFLADKSILRKLAWVVLSFSLSLAFILGNVGLMQGYEETFRQGLREGQGDILINSHKGFFTLSPEQIARIDATNLIERTNFFLQTEVFMIFEEHSKAILLKTQPPGIGPALKTGEILLGEASAQEWNIHTGDTVSLMFARGNTLGDGLPEVKNFVLAGIVKHKIYLRDSRVAYANVRDMEWITNAKGSYNLVALDLKAGHNTQEIANTVEKLNVELGSNYSIKPFWYEFSGLLEAVKVEKNIITIALQLIVLIAMFNMVSFFRLLFETHYPALFLLRSLGLELSALKFFLLLFSLVLWLVANVVALIWSMLFEWLLKHWSLLKLPGKIYQLVELQLGIGSTEILSVASIALIWILLLWWWFMRKMEKAELVKVMKGEWR